MVPLPAIPPARVVQLEPLQYWRAEPFHWMLPAVLLPHVPVPTMIEPFTCSVVLGDVVSIPTLPVLPICRYSVPLAHRPTVLGAELEKLFVCASAACVKEQAARQSKAREVKRKMLEQLPSGKLGKAARESVSGGAGVS